jgi:catechol 2,3-dioxygenase-like lactoylglutathione lyase family enzyme
VTGFRAQRLLRISRVVADLDRAEAFYRDALGFRGVGRTSLDPGVLAALGMSYFTAEQAVMRLGSEEIALVRFSRAGRPYPADSQSRDLWFQHLAIVVRDMDAAYAQLSAHGGWQPISWGGPQLLPRANGSERAFKFRDPDGHPLELIWFPPGQGRVVWHDNSADGPFLGIDHSALAVSLTSRSLAFYRRLGLIPADRSWNHGAPQSALDGLLDARVRVIGLRPASPDGPGLELLRYVPPGRPMVGPKPNDLITDWVAVAVEALARPSPGALRDPDGHILLLEGQGLEGAATGLPPTGLPAWGPAT